MKNDRGDTTVSPTSHIYRTQHLPQKEYEEGLPIKSMIWVLKGVAAMPVMWLRIP
jgi:hypothetical protein